MSGQCQAFVTHAEQSLGWNAIRARMLAVTRAGEAEIRLGSREAGVFFHSFLLATLRIEVVIVPHDRVHRDAVRA